MTARKDFALEENVKAIICRWTGRRRDEWRVQELFLYEEIMDFGRRCQNAAYEKAAKICRESVRMAEPGAATQWVECDKNPFQLEKEILALKTPEVKP